MFGKKLTILFAFQNDDDKKITSFVNLLKRKWEETRNNAATSNELRDPLMKSFFAYLYAVGQQELAACEVQQLFFKFIYVF